MPWRDEAPDGGRADSTQEGAGSGGGDGDGKTDEGKPEASPSGAVVRFFGKKVKKKKNYFCFVAYQAV